MKTILLVIFLVKALFTAISAFREKRKRDAAAALPPSLPQEQTGLPEDQNK